MTMIQHAIARSFICGFRIIMVICAVFAAGSAGMAWRIIPSRSAERVLNFGEVVAPNYDQRTR
jgi:hypothetical protein